MIVKSSLVSKAYRNYALFHVAAEGITAAQLLQPHMKETEAKDDHGE